jgi:PD-(D/E)XK endonuclease
MLTPSLKGAIAETAIIHEATKLGFAAMRPSIEGLRYDLIVDIGSRLLRVQVKWAARKGDVIAVGTRTCRSTPTRGYVRTTYSAQEIEGFGVYCPDHHECLWLPIEEFGDKTFAHLRLAPARNNQTQLVRWAKDYPFGAVAQLEERVTGSHEVRGSSPLSSIA